MLLPWDSVLFHDISSLILAIAAFHSVQYGFSLCFPGVLSLGVLSRKKSVVLIEKELDHIISGCELYTCTMGGGWDFLVQPNF